MKIMIAFTYILFLFKNQIFHSTKLFMSNKIEVSSLFVQITSNRLLLVFLFSSVHSLIV